MVNEADHSYSKTSLKTFVPELRGRAVKVVMRDGLRSKERIGGFLSGNITRTQASAIHIYYT